MTFSCPATSYCHYCPTQCGVSCIPHQRLMYLYERSLMPPVYQHPVPLYPRQDLEAYTILKQAQDDIVQFVKAGSSLFLYSPYHNNGKTTWACKLMNQYFRKVAGWSHLEHRGVFVFTPHFSQLFRQAVDDDNPAFFEFLKQIKDADLVIWDSIDLEVYGSLLRDQLTSTISYRALYKKSQIFTSATSLNRLESLQQLGPAAVAKIRITCTCLEFCNREWMAV